MAKTKELFPGEGFRELIDAGVFYGRKKSKVCPKMRPYILMNRGGIEIINLAKTLEGMTKVETFVKEKIQAGGSALFVATQPPAIDAMTMAKEFGFPYVQNRWVGGTLTNFKVILRRIEEFKKLRGDLASGALEKYTKKERLMIERDVKRLDELLGGLENLIRLPTMLIVIDSEVNATAVREARKIGIPVVAFSSVDADPDDVDVLVVGNTKARQSVNWFLSRIKLSIEEGKRTAVVEKSTTTAQATDVASATPTLIA